MKNDIDLILEAYDFDDWMKNHIENKKFETFDKKDWCELLKWQPQFKDFAEQHGYNGQIF